MYSYRMPVLKPPAIGWESFVSSLAVVVIARQCIEEPSFEPDPTVR